MAARSSGTISTSGRLEMTIPPTCWEMCRGRPAISSASSHSSFQSGALLRPVNPGSWSNSSASTPDQLFADLAREIEVDVRHRGEGLAQEPPDEEPGGDRIDVREAEQVAHDGGDGRAAAATRQQAALRPARAAPHVGGDLAREVEQIVIDEKEPAEPVVLDQSQFLGEPPLRLVAVQGAGGVA